MRGELAKQRRTSDDKASPRSPGSRLVNYGLPCANCRIYYLAHLAACPVCGCEEQISANSRPGVGGY